MITKRIALGLALALTLGGLVTIVGIAAAQRFKAPSAPPAVRLADSPAGVAPANMVWIPGGEFTMGSDDAEPAEAPAHRVRLDGFWIDATEVTNTQFARFVDTTGYVTTAERKPDWEELKKQVPPGTPKPPDDQLVPASMVFTPPDAAVPLDDFAAWWTWVPGASWR